MQAGMRYHEAKNLPAREVNPIITAHWQSQGLKTERMRGGEHGLTFPKFDRHAKFEQLQQRQKSWRLEQL